MKMTYKRGITYLFTIILFFSVSSCDLFDLDVNTDPNNPSQASLNLLLTNSMLDGAAVFAGNLNDAAHGFVGLTTNTDDFNMTNATWNNTWNFLYSGPLNDLERIIIAATEQGNNPHYLGVAQVLKAYYFSLMVDLWGDVPYTEAFRGDLGMKEPAYTDDAAIYADLNSLLDQAIANFALTSPVAVKGDLIYSGSIAKWKKAANSLKLKFLVTTRNTDPNAGANIQALIDAVGTSGLIWTAGDDFQFRFGRLVNPDDRHPMYQDAYAGGEAGYDYFGHQFMVEMLVNHDPRTPFYFKRQTSDILDPADPTDKQTIPCSQRDDCIYGYLIQNAGVIEDIFQGDYDADAEEYLAGFFGRDRSDPSGVPNDNPLRTTVGVYPAGGLFDDVPETGGGNKGAGDGIFPMLTSWMVKFYLIEANLKLGVTIPGSDAELLEDALTEQMSKVFSVAAAADPTIETDETAWDDTYDWPLTFKTRDEYIADVLSDYSAVTGEDAKLNFVLKQAWFANFGNGFEIYNAFRRTGFPNDLQEPLQLPRQFALRLPYVQDELNLNSNTPTVVYDSPTDAVFWDALKFQF
jgi:hypothetical protein